MTTAFGAFHIVKGIQTHFTNEKYDYFKFSGKYKIRAKLETFENNPQRFFFEKLSRHPEIELMVVATILEKGAKCWIGDIVSEDGERRYFKLKGMLQSFSNRFSNEIEMMQDDFNSNFTVKEGQHPFFFKLLLSRKISKETFLVMDEIVKFSGRWNVKLDNDYMWGEMRKAVDKYKPFVLPSLDIKRCKEILLTKFEKE